MPRLALHDPDELDPLRRRYVKILLHAATTGAPPEPSPMGAGLVLCDVLAQRLVRGREEPDPGVSLEWRTDALLQPPFYVGLSAHAQAVACLLLGTFAAQIESAGRQCFRTLSRSLVQSPIQRPEILAADGAADACAAAWSSVAVQSLARCMGAAVTLVKNMPIADALMSQYRIGTGAFFENTNQHNPEAGWYHELVMLHAVASFAAITGDDVTARSVRRAALFHHRETQPDHATSQPWAIHAFLLDPETVPTADLVLLAAGVNRPEGLDAVSRILLADAAVCLMTKPRE